jgi:hypothetical protein
MSDGESLKGTGVTYEIINLLTTNTLAAVDDEDAARKEYAAVCRDDPEHQAAYALVAFDDDGAGAPRSLSTPLDPTGCGWCHRAVYDWSVEGWAHYDGVCIGNAPGSTETALRGYHRDRAPREGWSSLRAPREGAA